MTTKLDEIACLQWSSSIRLGQRLNERGHGNDLDACNVDAVKDAFAPNSGQTKFCKKA